MAATPAAADGIKVPIGLSVPKQTSPPRKLSPTPSNISAKLGLTVAARARALADTMGGSRIRADRGRQGEAVDPDGGAI
ncbi:hypothetical protein GCM10007908_22510 [Rhizobium albus]|nr:hypothetical protein GCM10007908_22510 [Rhizobium albus]